jgi:hypothetical protein
VRRALILLMGLALAGCSTFGARLPPGNAGGTFLDEGPAVMTRGEMSSRRAAIDASELSRARAKYRILRDLVESSHALREQIRRRREVLLKSFEGEKRVGQLERELVVEGAIWFLQLDTLLYDLWLDYRDYLPYGSEPDPYAPHQAASLLSDETRAKGGLVALTAEIVRMENARVVVAQLGDQIALTRFLNRGDTGRGIPTESYDRVVGALKDPDRRALLQRQLFAIARNKPRLVELGRRDGEIAFMLSLIERSEVARELLDERGLGRQLRYLGAAIAHSGAALLSPFLDLYISAVVASEEEEKEQVLETSVRLEGVDRFYDQLRPHDIVLIRDITREGSPVGFTHASLYLGELSGLRAAAPDHPALLSRGADLRRGRLFLEAAPTGLLLNDLDAAGASQVLAILRVDELDADEAARASLDALMDPVLTSPPKIWLPDHSGRLISFVHGAALELEVEPTFQRIVDALATSPTVQVVWLARGEDLFDGAEARRVFDEVIEKAGPTDERPGVADSAASE